MSALISISLLSGILSPFAIFPSVSMVGHFNFSDISGMDFGGKCQLLLAEVLLGAELTDSFSHDDGEIGSVFHDDYLSFCAESLLWILGNTNCQDTKGMILFILSVFFCRIKSI